ncbi:MAG: hypothetical protein IPN70_05470 [Candidatus Moraniibacteriota bacterium]|nr:MAG: hypothetical protein IPN70_05470 [Candidatus Moranbacteria bacterium]
MFTKKPITKITFLVGIALVVSIFATRSPLLQPTSSGEEYIPQSFSSLLGIDYMKNVWNRIFGSVPVTIEVGSDIDAASNPDGEGSASCANYKAGDTLGRYSTQYGMFLLEDSDGSGLTKEIQYGLKDANWKGLVGDWNGDGWDTIGTYDPAKAKFFLKNQNAPGNADAEFIFNPTNGKGLNNLIPLTGDWNGDKIDTVGLFDPQESRFFLLNKNVASNSADFTFQFGTV